ncbi:MAG: M56 family metallopeptidase [Verrucomicrobiales bacterium]
MNTLVFTRLTEAVGWSLLHFLWQATAVSLLLVATLRLMRKCRPEARYAVSVTVFFAMVGCFAATAVSFCSSTAIPLIQFRPAGTEVPTIRMPAVSVAAQQAEPSPSFAPLTTAPEGSAATIPFKIPFTESSELPALAVSERIRPMLPWAVGVWLFGVAFFSLRFAFGWRSLRRLRSGAIAVVDPALLACFQTIADALRLSRPVKLLASAAISVPVAMGILKPAVMLPLGLLTRLTPLELEAVLAHELAHIRRHDYLVNLLQNVIETIFFFHPGVWWISAQIRQERENCCDDHAVRFCGGAIPYAKALANLEELRGFCPNPGLAVTGGALLSRVRRLLGRPEEKSAAWPTGMFLLGTAAVLLSVTMLRAAHDEFFSSPQAAHISDGERGSFCVHDGGKTQWIFLTSGQFNSSSNNTSDSKLRSWKDEVAISLPDGRTASFSRSHEASESLSVTYWSRPQTHDLTKGYVLYLDGDIIRQLDLKLPPITDATALQAVWPAIVKAANSAKFHVLTSAPRREPVVEQIGHGVTLELQSRLYHGPNTDTRAILRWPGQKSHIRLQVASDTMGNGQPFVVFWEEGQNVLWIAGGPYTRGAVVGPWEGKQLQRIDLRDPNNVTEQQFDGIPADAGPSKDLLDKVAQVGKFSPNGKYLGHYRHWPVVGENPPPDGPGQISVFLRKENRFQVGAQAECGLEELVDRITKEAAERKPPYEVSVHTPTGYPTEQTEAVINALQAAGVVAEKKKEHAKFLQIPGQEPVMIVSQLGFYSEDGALVFPVTTSDLTFKIDYQWTEAEPGSIRLKSGAYQSYRYDLKRGRVFYVLFDHHQFYGSIFQVPASVEIPADSTKETLAATLEKAAAWYDKADDRTRWEQTRVALDDGEYGVSGQPLDAAAEKILWGEANEIGLRLGLGGMEPGTSVPVGQQLPLKQYLRNDGKETLRLSPTGIFNEGIGGELKRISDGKTFAHQKGYPWPIGFVWTRLAPGHYIQLGTGPLRTKDPSNPVLGMMEHGFAVSPGDYTMHLTHGIGQFIDRPRNTNWGDPSIAPGLGEWTGILKSAPFPITFTEFPGADQTVRTAITGDRAVSLTEHEKGQMNYNLQCDKGKLSFGRSDGSTLWIVHGDAKAPADYTAAWLVQGKRLWLRSADDNIQCIEFDPGVKEIGTWPAAETNGDFGGMPDPVRKALNLTKAQQGDAKIIERVATKKPGNWALANGAQLHIYCEVFHGSDVATTAVFTWPGSKDRSAQYWYTGVASDAFAARVPWAVAWDTEFPVLWIAVRDLGSQSKNADGKPIASQLRRIDFADPNHIREETFTGWPKENAPSPEVIAQMSTHMEVREHDRSSSALHSWTSPGSPEKIDLTSVQNIHISLRKDGSLTVRLDEEKACTEAELAETLKGLVGEWISKRRSNLAGQPVTHRVTISVENGPDTSLLEKIMKTTRESLGSQSAQSSLTVRGLSLAGLPVTHLRVDLRDLYSADPAKPGEFLRKPGFFEMSLGFNGPWILYPVGSGHFYVEVRPDPKTVKDDIYGPIPGDPVEKLDLAAWLADSPNHRDPGYARRVARDMVISGDPSLTGIALAWMGEFPLPSPPQANERWIQAMDEFLKTSPAAATAPEVAKLLEKLRENQKQATAEWDKLRKTLPEDSYAEPKAIIGDLNDVLWGEPSENGLQLGIRGVGEDTKLNFGETMTVDLLVRNTGNQPVKFAWTPRHDEGIAPYLKRADGYRLLANIIRNSILLVHSRCRLQPGQVLAYKNNVSYKLVKANADGTNPESEKHQDTFLLSEPGTYHLEIEGHLGVDDWTGSAGKPQPRPAGEWSGVLKAKAVRLSAT